MTMLKTSNGAGVITKGLAVWIIALGLCSAAVVHADISISDNWDRTGRLSLETENVIVVFSKGDAGLLVYSKSKQAKKESMKIVPFYSPDSQAQSTIGCKIIRSTANQVEVGASFSAAQKTIEGSFLVDESGTIQVKPSQNFNGISILSPIKYAVLPSRIVDDVIYDPVKYPRADQLHLPSENLLMGLLDGRDRILVCAWPPGKQQVRVLLEDEKPDQHSFRAVDVELDGKSIYLGILLAPGIWHKEELLPSYLEKDVEIPWKKPFQARWKAQLFERGELETAYPFRSRRSDIWRPGFGAFIYPLWFQEDKTFIHLSKKVPPAGHVLIYALEGHKNTPMEFARRCVGDIPSLGKAKRGLQDPGYRVGLHSCDGRDYMQRIFSVGLQKRERKLLLDGLDDFMGTAKVFGDRLVEYDNFIQRMKAKIDSWLQAHEGNPELQPFLNKMKHHLEKVELEYRRRMGDRTAPELLSYEIEAINIVKSLVGDEGLEGYAEAKYFLWESNISGGRIEIVPTMVGGQAREWSRQAAYSCAHNVAAVKFAEEIRREIREFIGNGTLWECVY